MPNKNLILRKIKQILEYLKELKTYEKLSRKDFLSNFEKYHTVERLIQLIVDTAVDINQHILVDSGSQPADDYFNSFIKLSSFKIYSGEFAKKIAESAGLRNRIIHEYGGEEFSYDILYDSVKDALKIYPEYLTKIQAYIE